MGFDIPVENFKYSLNGSSVAEMPQSIRLSTASNGGLFTLFFGPQSGYDTSGNPIPELSLSGAQLFTGSTSSPTIVTGSFATTDWTYSDANNFDTQAHAMVSAVSVPEPSAWLLSLSGIVLLVLVRKIGPARLSRAARRKWAHLGICALLLSIAIKPLSAEVPITPAMNIPNTGQVITPLAPRGARFTYLNPGLSAYPNYVVAGLVTAVTSPDHKTLLLLTTGVYGLSDSAGNKDIPASTEWIFVFDITRPVPVQKQAIQVTRAYNGIVWDPSGSAFYVAGGNEDNVHVYTQTGGKWGEAADSPIALGNTQQVSGVNPEAAGIAITKDGSKLVVTNYENDSITVLTKSGATWAKTGYLDLRPGVINPAQDGVPGGEFPFWVSIAGNDTAYVSSLRDRQICVVNISNGSTPTLTSRIGLKGEPLKSVLNAAQTVLYVAEDQTDSIAVINTQTNKLVSETKVVAPAGVVPSPLATVSGANTNSVTLSPDEKTLYVTNGNSNDIAVVDVSKLVGGRDAVKGLIPTAMYPNHVAVSGDGNYLYVVNGKSPTGPNPNWCSTYVTKCYSTNDYTLQLIAGGLQFLPTPAASHLPALTAQVIENNHFQAAESSETTSIMDFLATKVKHIIYIIKENRTYDQVLGDIPGSNGDPSLTIFPASVTPNEHKLAENFVNFDNFYDTAEVSYDGWSWSTSAMAPDMVIRQTLVNYSYLKGTSYDSEGDNRNVNMTQRRYSAFSGMPNEPITDPNILPGLTNAAAPDGPGNRINEGYLWNPVLNAHKSVRNYGFYIDNVGKAVPYPMNTTTRQVYPSNPQLNPNTDIYFRGYDMNNADYYLYQEWYREFSSGHHPTLTLIRLPHDHMGSFTTALAGLNTPDLQVADNDYAVGSIIDTIAHSSYASNTLVFVIEDDAQDGPDHVDAHRSIAFIAGPYVKHNALISTQYNTLNFIRTMERILGLPPLHLTDGLAQPMADAFDTAQASWTFAATPAPVLYNSTLPLPPKPTALQIPKPVHDGKYWANAMKGFDFSDADRVDPQAFNRILWKGMKGDTLYPGDANLAETHKRYKDALKKRSVAATNDDEGQ
ncbi:MAG: beta-propeller fold lactonase family protein [Acidobacteriaceae bacterium]|nr:beta-propeller fold lactonase family protein [Acidobacteriaceae bacterium]